MNLLFVLPLLCAVVTCWSNADLDIFKLRENIIQDLGPDTTFYSWLGVKADADAVTINKAYRKLSRAIHPDRNPGKEATERFARLNNVHKILRSPNRDRYDFYLKKGFPELKDGEYLFSRWKPGFITAVILLAGVTTALQFAYLYSTAHQQRAKIQSIVDEAKATASGPMGVVTMRKQVKLANGHQFVVYPAGNVALLEGSEELSVDPTDIPLPTWSDTWLGLLVTKVSGSSPATSTKVSEDTPSVGTTSEKSGRKLKQRSEKKVS